MREIIGNNDNTFVVGPFLSNSDGITPVTSFALSACNIAAVRKNGNNTPVDISANSWAAVASMGGHFNLTLTSSQCDTFGPARISIQKSGSMLPYFEDLDLVTSHYWLKKHGTDPLASQISSLDVRVQALPSSSAINGMVLTLPSSAMVQALPTSSTLSGLIAALPNSATLNALGITLPTSAIFTARVSSLDVRVQSVSAQITGVASTQSTQPTSTAMVGWFNTLPNSQTLNAHIITLPTSTVLYTAIGSVWTQIGSLDVRVSSIALGGGASAADVWDYGSRTLTSAGAGGATQAECQSACYSAIVAGYLMGSGDVTARFATLPTSLTLNAWMITMPTSIMVAALPNSATLNALGITLPTSAMWGARVNSLDARVSSVDARVAGLNNLSLTQVTSGIFGYAVESGWTLLNELRVQDAFMVGVASGGGTSSLVFRDKGDTKNRLVMSVDSAGNRSAVTRDGD